MRIIIKPGDVLVFDTETVPNVKENNMGIVLLRANNLIFTDLPNTCLDKRDWMVTNFVQDKWGRKVFIKRRA